MSNIGQILHTIYDIFVLNNNGKTFPAALVAPVRGKLIWMVDAAAAQLLDSEIQTMGIIK